MPRLLLVATLAVALVAARLAPALAADDPRALATATAADRRLAAYFRAETQRLADACLTDVADGAAWQARRPELRRQLIDMLGLDPAQVDGPREPVPSAVTGQIDRDDFRVEKVYFQSRPGLYVTGNLYLPKTIDQPVPAILYLCGHGEVKKNGVSYGNKVHYQHHGIWFARHGYVCLVIDSHQLGEIEGLHHGTHRLNQWWWVSRGYTPAGIEAWNCLRAVDYLQSRPEVDRERIGATGRSGGGAYSWWIAALDERIKAAVPVAGITDLENHVVDGCVEGHCDCMYLTNTYRWDYPAVAALVAPRPLLLSNTDRDPIFPLEGVVRTHAKVRRVYQALNAGPAFALQITAGGHVDTQELHIHAFRWFDQHLLGVNRQIDKPAVKLFEPEELKVFAQLPRDAINAQAQTSFVPAAPLPAMPESAVAWQAQRDAWLAALRERTFAGWPRQAEAPALRPAFRAEHDGIVLAAWDFDSQDQVPLRLFVAQPAAVERPKLCVLNLLDDAGWRKFLAGFRGGFAQHLNYDPLPPADAEGFAELQGLLAQFGMSMAYVAPRGAGPHAWSGDAKKQNQIARRFLLLGQTLDGMRVWDARRAIQALRATPNFGETPLWLQAEGPSLAGAALYASLFEPDIQRLDLYGLPRSHQPDGPVLLNVLRTLDLPVAVALAAERSQVLLYQAEEGGWEYPQAVVRALGWNAKQFQIRRPPADK